MKTNITFSKGSWIQLNQHRAVRAGMLLLLLLTLPGVVQAQFTYTNNNSTITITGYTGPGGAVTIPSVINGLPVTTIGVSAFYNLYNITSVTIPTSVTSIKQRAFDHCIGLTSVTIGNSVTNIGDYAFQNCSLTSVTIPASVTSIGKGPLNFCTNLMAITVEALNSAYSSVDGVLFNKSQVTLIQCPGGKVGSYAVPNSVTSIADWAFHGCPSLSNIMIPNSVTNFGQGAFEYCGLTSLMIPNSITSIGIETFCACWSLTNVMIPNSVTDIGQEAFYECTRLTSVTIPASVTNIGAGAFTSCDNLTELYFEGNAPSTSSLYLNNATVYYSPGTTGWGPTFGGCPTALWTQVPTIQTPPQTQTAEATSAVGLRVKASSPLPLFYFWYLNHTNLLSSGTNWQLDLPNVQFAQSGAYTVEIRNELGTVTSVPAILNVIAPVERRPVPGVKVTGATASLWNVDYADSLTPAPTWTPLGSVNLTGTPQYCFDLTLPLPPQRFYRGWQTGTPGVVPSLDLHLVPAITLTGSIGHSVRLDYINQYGPIDAWATLATVPLTNTSQLYFDISAPGQPPRLYRLVPSP